jgi:hypothetical protein
LFFGGQFKKILGFFNLKKKVFKGGKGAPIFFFFPEVPIKVFQEKGFFVSKFPVGRGRGFRGP